MEQNLKKKKTSFLPQAVAETKKLGRESILGYTSQRYWEDGRRYKENDENYNNSYWMKGISMSRDFNYALGWGAVLFIFDKDLIQKKHEIQPYSWNFHINSEDNLHSKKEREDFVILSKKKKYYKNKENPDWIEEYNQIKDVDIEELKKQLPEDEIISMIKLKSKLRKEQENINIKDLKEPEGEFDFSSNGLVGIVLREHILRIYGLEDPTVQYIINHPSFLGILEHDK